MFHKVKDVNPRANLMLDVMFADGTTKEYDVAPLLEKFTAFEPLIDEGLFESVNVDPGGYGVSWNDDIDLSCDELWDNGVTIETPFDGLMAFSTAADLWGLSDSTLRKALVYGKIRSGIDARKYGKQWIVTRGAMIREYGEPKEPERVQ
ncbi:DUF2442 domain-containing protein [uncultured Senegalimassilia sp.]|uniref:DUF2442 domain-containing protein n=1 Tax=uncultured Senegalimassilia sp. TaxID=1714350 RepID=UPI002672598D|nr:DUF2442 domain-containing protein [uncultured Senegalimassilia sp.]